VLDEPTNDLDLETLDLLEEMIDDYPAPLMLVSHDRDFLDRTVTAVVVVKATAAGTSMRAATATWWRSAAKA